MVCTGLPQEDGGQVRKARRHQKEVEACNVIMSYGFVVIILLLTAIYAFVMIFSEELRSMFEVGSKPLHRDAGVRDLLPCVLHGHPRPLPPQPAAGMNCSAVHYGLRYTKKLTGSDSISSIKKLYLRNI